MILDIDDLNDTISTLTQDIDCQLEAFSSKMDSKHVNDTFNKMTSILNSLYEKTRLLEDLRVFTEQYIQNEFKKKEASLKQGAKIIQESGSDYENTAVIAHEIDFNQNITVAVDRDGTPVSIADTDVPGVIMAFSDDLDTARIEHINVSSNELAYRRITTPSDRYRSFYVLHLPNSDGIKETLQIIFKNPLGINYINFDQFHSEVESISIIRYDNQLIPVDLKIKGIKPVRAKGIQVVLKSNVFERMSVDIPVKNYDTKKTFTNSEIPKDIVQSIFEEYEKERK